MAKKRAHKPIQAGVKEEKKTERINQTKWFKLITRNGVSFRFEAEDYYAAHAWTMKQFEIMGLVYPLDIRSLEEEK